MRFVITGSSGLIGTALRAELRKGGHQITPVVRRKAGPGQVSWSIERGTIETTGLEDHDVAIHLAGESIAGIWTAGKKQRIRDSRAKGTRLFASALAQLRSPPHTLLSMSGINIYGDRDFSEPITEQSSQGRGFLADVTRLWEAGTEDAEKAGIRIIHARAAPALSEKGGALGVQLPIFKLGLGASFGSGRQPWSWIALDDLIRAQLFAIDNSALRGPVNLTSPGAVTNAEATQAIAEAVHRPAFLRIPAFVARLAPGGMADELLLSGARVVPEKLLEAGFEFRYPELTAALRAILS